MIYPIAEKFKSPQGEGLYTGVPMAFIRFIGCSVGQKICTACDTDFDQVYEKLGGGRFSVEDLAEWAGDYIHVCLTGGEPLDRQLLPLINHLQDRHGKIIHVETSGTIFPSWLREVYRKHFWLCVSPKPGYLQDMISTADEIKVILGGLGAGPGWPSLEDAVRWADEGKLVYLQPRNEKFLIDRSALQEVIETAHQHPRLRISVQMHKFMEVR
jgi:7-carboxy-7-deazaguanine synthase